MTDTPALRAFADEMFDAIAAMSRDEAGVSRPAYSEIETEVLDWLRHWAQAQGLTVQEDSARNLLFSLPDDVDAPRYVLVGSHVDSVPRGGNYDGLAGGCGRVVVSFAGKRRGPPAPPAQGDCHAGRGKRLVRAMLHRLQGADRHPDGHRA